MRFEATQIVGNTRMLIQQNLGLGGSISIAASFPQIGISMSAYPQSACHMVEAWAGAGSENNPRGRFGPHRPHLVKIDRAGNVGNARRNPSTYPYKCSNAPVDHKDEYPQAVFYENGGAASIKCVLGTDNTGSGSQIRNQINGAKFYGGNSNPYGRLEDDSVVEMTIRQ
jgi:hypothetical protein